MHPAQEARPRARSPFVAAFLSLLFPGLGHAYAGAWQRALGFAAPPVLVTALLAGVFFRLDGVDLLALLVTPWVAQSVFVLNLVALVYRLVAIVDAWRVATFLNAVAGGDRGRLGPPRVPLNTISVAGLLAVLVVTSGGHAVVAKYDMQALGFFGSCIFLDNSSAECDAASPSPSGSATATDPPVGSDSPEPSLTEPPVQGSALPNVTIPPWDGSERLNVLLIGSDQRPNEGSYNTDTLIVVSIDPTTGQVAMFSLPRDSVGVPLPSGPLRQAFGSTYRGKINAFFSQVRSRADLVPGTDRTRGYNGLKMVLGELYGLDIKYFVEVNFEGFKKVVDAMGGVTINVQIPVVDDRYPSDTGRLSRVYIPAGIQHMSGAQALVYARSRHTSSDFDRGARQQRVLTSLREQADVAKLIPRIPELLAAVEATVRTDVPQDELGKLAGLAAGIDTRNIRSYVFSYPRYGSQVLAPIYEYRPDVKKIRTAVANAFKVDPRLEDRRDTFGQEGARIWVLNGSGTQGHASGIATYLEYYGLTASAPAQKPDAVPKATRIVVYNGAEAELTATVEFLEAVFETKVALATDPAARVDIVITTTRGTPALVPPEAP